MARLSRKLLACPIVGKKYGRLTVTSDSASQDNHGRRYWLFLCDCGNTCQTEAAKVVKGKILTCGCLRRETASVRNKKYADPLLKYRRCVIWTYRRHAQKIGQTFELPDEQFFSLMECPCFYCGRREVALRKARYGDLKYNGVDRLDCGRGYIEGNCVSCCKTCNIMKQSLSVDEFIAHLELIAAHIGKP